MIKIHFYNCLKAIMLNKKLIVSIALFIFSNTAASILYAQPDGPYGLGQIIQITTSFNRIVGNPTWLLEIRDLDHNQTIPYLMDIRQGDNYWTFVTYSRHYLVQASNLQIELHKPYNDFRNYRTTDFCHLESRGRILKGESISVFISGDLTPNTNTYSCQVSIYPDNIVTQ